MTRRRIGVRSHHVSTAGAAAVGILCLERLVRVKERVVAQGATSARLPLAVLARPQGVWLHVLLEEAHGSKGGVFAEDWSELDSVDMATSEAGCPMAADRVVVEHVAKMLRVRVFESMFPLLRASA